MGKGGELDTGAIVVLVERLHEAQLSLGIEVGNRQSGDVMVVHRELQDQPEVRLYDFELGGFPYALVLARMVGLETGTFRPVTYDFVSGHLGDEFFYSRFS